MGLQKLSWKSWGIQLYLGPIEEQFWDTRGVDILNVHLEEYVAALSQRVQALPSTEGTA